MNIKYFDMSMTDLIYKSRRKIRKYLQAERGKYLVNKFENEEPCFGLNTDLSRKEKIVISLTSYPSRYRTICSTLKSLCLQTLKADRITVWLYADPKNINRSEISSEMEEYIKYGVEFFFVNEDLKPHKKYFYAMQKFKDANIITVDDDVIYPMDLVKSLFDAHLKYPDCICARRVHLARFSKEGRIFPYKDWYFEYTGKYPSIAFWPTGVGGVLYPPDCLPDETFNIQVIQENCLNADDLWLKIMGTKAGCKVMWVKNNLLQPPCIEETQVISLKASNVIGGGNDEVLGKLYELYPEIFELIAIDSQKENVIANRKFPE